MSRRGHPLLFSSMTACAFAVSSGVALSNDAPDLSKSLLQDWAKAWESGEVGKMMGFYIDSPDLVAIESLGNVRRGTAGVRAMYRDAFDELRFEKVTLTPETSARQGDLAWAVVRFRAEVRLKTDGGRYVLESRGSFVMKQDEQGWKIVMEHFSTVPDTPRVQPVK